MGLVIRLHDIVSPSVSGFTVSYKEGVSPYPINDGYTTYANFPTNTNVVNISGVTLNFNSTYWIKITDRFTGRYIIENIETNDPIAYMDCCPQPVSLGAVCYHSCYPPTINSISCVGLADPTPTPTPTPTSAPATATPTPTPTPTSAPATATPTPTPTDVPGATATATPTPTPTATPTPYYLLLSRCDSAPNTVTGWTLNAYTQSQIQVGDIFYSAGGYYYQVINYQIAQPSPAGTIDGTKSNDYTSCDQTPGHYVAPTPDPGQSILIHIGQTFSNTTEPCAMYESAIATNSQTVYLNGHNVPVNGDYAYNTAACNVGDEYSGNSNYYAALANSTKYAFTIGSGGYINNVTACGAMPTATATPTPTPTPTSIPLVGLFKSQGLSEFNSHCNNNYLINSPFFGTTISINSLYGTYVYSDMNYTPFDGGSLWYAVGSDDQANTSDLPYYSIQVAGNGEVLSVQYITSCSGGGSQA